MTSSPILANLKPNPAWALLPIFDRTGWQRMAFGAFAESMGERAEPKDAQEEIYVGLHWQSSCSCVSSSAALIVGGQSLRFCV